MANDMDNVSEKPTTAPFTSERLRNLVLDHVLDNSNTFLGDGPGVVDRFTQLMDSLVELTEKVALEALANRVHLSELPTFSGKIQPNPDADINDDRLYETRFRMLEHRAGDDVPIRDDVLTKGEALATYGEEYVETYWGGLGERCPNSVTTGDRTIWFSVVRYPVESKSLDQSSGASAKQGYRAPSLG